MIWIALVICEFIFKRKLIGLNLMKNRMYQIKI